MAIPVLECRALSKNYGSFTALSNFNLQLQVDYRLIEVIVSLQIILMMY